tara:strand:- start:4601 stop:5221 length:621 start_codon:yes stop_codon:yes gene_type:complete
LENYLYEAKFTFFMVGNLSNFTKIDILRCLLKIENPVSRAQLSKISNLGEGTIRSILNILKKNNLLESNNKGHYLSAKGSRIIKKIKGNITIKEIILNNFLPNKKKVALHIKNPNKLIKSYVLRDEAVKNGADGALVFKFDKKLELYDSNYEQDFSEAGNEFDLDKNDLVIVSYADSYRLAEYGALAASTGLNKELKDIMGNLKSY